MSQLASIGAAIRTVAAPPHKAGHSFIAAAAIATLAGLVYHLDWLAILGAVLALACLMFFRDPERVPSVGTGVMLAPADGRVVAIDAAVPPAELGLGDAPMQRVAIFLSVLDVHVNRMPAAGRVLRVARRPGAFVSASLDKAADENERVAMSVELADGRVYAVVQIAGLIARRILSDATEGATFAAGERFGIIRFGSRTDLYLPPSSEVRVRYGQTMIGGETIVAVLAAA